MNENIIQLPSDRIVTNFASKATLDHIAKLEKQIKILSDAMVLFQQLSGLTKVESNLLCFERKVPVTPEQAALLNALDDVMVDLQGEKKS